MSASYSGLSNSICRAVVLCNPYIMVCKCFLLEFANEFKRLVNEYVTVIISYCKSFKVESYVAFVDRTLLIAISINPI